jgi:TetR/AcrR family transcriptional regulator, cholesterol catabolism regulator
MTQCPTFNLLQEAAKDLVKQAMAVFLRFGIKSVNMEDLAKELGVSKKTLYKHFQDKNELIQLGMEHHCLELEAIILEASSAEGNAIDSELRIMKHVHEVVSQMHPSILYDLQKYHPIAFSNLVKTRDEILLGAVENNIQRGQNEGVYRQEVDPVSAARFLVSISTTVREMAQDHSNIQPLAQLYWQSALYHIHAISSPEGLDYLQKKLAADLQPIP